MANLSLYTKTFRMILNLREGEDVSWVPVYESFCDLRESLLCGVCLKLTVVPYQRFTDQCSHNLCRECLGGRLQVPCIWCADIKNFEDNVQLRILLQCYKNMCKFIMSCDFFRSSLLSDMSLPKLNFISMVTEGSKLNDDYHYTSTHRLFGKRLRLLFAEPENIQNMNGGKTVYRLRLNHDKPALQHNMQENCSDSEKHSSFTGGLSAYLLQKPYMAPRQRNCHCGITTVHHRKLICRSQRCPCFVAGRSCFNCRCRGCRNTQKFRSGPTRFQKYRPHNKIMHVTNGIEDQAKTADQVLVNSSDD